MGSRIPGKLGDPCFQGGMFGIPVFQAPGIPTSPAVSSARIPGGSPGAAEESWEGRDGKGAGTGREHSQRIPRFFPLFPNFLSIPARKAIPRVFPIFPWNFQISLNSPHSHRNRNSQIFFSHRIPNFTFHSHSSGGSINSQTSPTFQYFP